MESLRFKISKNCIYSSYNFCSCPKTELILGCYLETGGISKLLLATRKCFLSVLNQIRILLKSLTIVDNSTLVTIFSYSNTVKDVFLIISLVFFVASICYDPHFILINQIITLKKLMLVK